MKILVTGGAGFIASHIVDALIEEGHDVLVIDDLSRGNKSNVNPRARLYEVDICSPEIDEIFKKEQPELINHHAARTSVSHSVSDPIDDARVNILGSLNLLQNAIKYKVKKIIYASSGGALYGEPQSLPCNEDHPINPLSPYGASKHTVEHYINIYRINFGLDYTVLRYANVYGPRQNPLGEAGVVAVFSNCMPKEEAVTIYGTGQQERDFVYVADIVKANLLAVENGSGQIYNLGSGESISINELFRSLKTLTGYKKEPVYAQARSGEVVKIYLAIDRIKQELGWIPEVNLKQGLKQTLEFYTKPNS